jgi:hypothetical protein
VVPEEYQKCMVGMKQNLKHVLEIGEAASDPKIKLEARLMIAIDISWIFCTNASIVSDAMKYVTQKQEQIDTLKKLDKRIEAIEEEKTTEEVY